MANKKTIKISFKIILRNERTGSEIDCGKIKLAVPINVSKKNLQKIAEENMLKEVDEGDKQTS